jgi:hypothetical protein
MTAKPSRKAARSADRGEVLCISAKPKNQSLVKRHYLRARSEPVRCDISSCIFHTQPLSWNGRPLVMILDHVDGNNCDNTPDNLRLLCPNCNSQQPTHGGANRGRVLERREDGSTVLDSNGSRVHKRSIRDGVTLSDTLSKS